LAVNKNGVCHACVSKNFSVEDKGMTSTLAAGMRVLLLPGWQNSGRLHWQSRWEALHGHQRVEQAEWEWPKRGDWMARLDEVLLESSTPALLAAHSLGTQLVAAWAAHSQHAARVRGVLLVAPPDLEREDMPPQLHGWRPMKRQRLPFASTVVFSSDDPFCAADRALRLAADWGAVTVAAGPRGHMNSDSGLGDWPEGLALLHALTAD
jgi:uncharacterized protein